MRNGARQRPVRMGSAASLVSGHSRTGSSKDSIEGGLGYRQVGSLSQKIKHCTAFLLQFFCVAVFPFTPLFPQKCASDGTRHGATNWRYEMRNQLYYLSASSKLCAPQNTTHQKTQP